MQYRILGNTGVKVSVIGLGANNFGGRNDEPSSFRVLDQALDLGVNFIDTADVYNLGKSEQVIGNWIKGRRDRLVIATKFVMAMDDYPNSKGASRYHIFNAVEDSLRRLNTDHIDLYQVHWPDPETPIEQTLRALDDLVKQGKIRYFRLLQLLRTPTLGSPVDLPVLQPEQPGIRAVLLQPAQEGSGKRGRTLRRRQRPEHHPFLPVGVGTAHREIP